MFGWPEQLTNKFVAAHSDPTDDFVDRLNYIYTVALLMFMATLTGAKQHFGSAIQCMVPAHFPGTWVGYVQDYCFVSNTYMVNMSTVVAKGDTNTVFKEKIVYYQWVPYILFVQALLCYLPKFLWYIVIVAHDLDMRSVVEEAMKLPSITILSTRQKHLKKVADFAVGYIKYKQGSSAVAKEVIAYTIEIIIFKETILLESDLKFMEEVLKGNDWKTSGVFPRVTFCDVSIAQIGQANTHTVQCVLMINMLNEKLYVALWFWLTVLALIDAVSAVNSTLLLLCPYLHYMRVLSLLQANGRYTDMEVKRCLLNFTENVLRLDGILLLSFIRDRVNGMIASDLTHEIWATADSCKRNHCTQKETYDGDDLVTQSRSGGINAFGPVVRKNA
uniref:Innexin n=1 Tax=Setaria digitata TaxID=48799 RepID=A0A915Q4Y9_9BILA